MITMQEWLASEPFDETPEGIPPLDEEEDDE